METYHFTLFSVDCQWSSWTPIGSCSKSCGGGSQKSKRYKTVSESNGGSCSGLSEKTYSCNTQKCPQGPEKFPEKCKTVSGPDAHKPCIFPFRFNGVSYNTCTLVSTNDNKPWCSTRVDNSGTHVSDGGYYGDCGPKCPMPTGK